MCLVTVSMLHFTYPSHTGTVCVHRHRVLFIYRYCISESKVRTEIWLAIRLVKQFLMLVNDIMS